MTDIYTLFSKACDLRDLRQVKEIVQENRDLGLVITEENLLKIATKAGDLHATEYLIEENSFHAEAWSKMACFHAAESGHVDMVKHLSKTYDVDVKIWGDAILQSISLYGHLEMMKYLIEELDLDISVEGVVALAFASEKGHLDVVKYLVEECDVDIHCNNEHALAAAAHDEHSHVVKYLIKRGADYTVLKNYKAQEKEYKFCHEFLQKEVFEKEKLQRTLDALKKEGGAKCSVRRRPKVEHPK